MEEYSFSYNVKKEIIEKINTKPKADACLMGILAYCNELSDREILFLTENKAVADFFILNVNRITEDDSAVKVTTVEKKNGVVLYSLEVSGENNRIYLLDYFQMDQSRRLTKDELPKEKFYPYLIGGIFLACGSVNNPEKKYHMEFVMPSVELSNDFGLLMIENYAITPKYVERKNAHIVYIKESENIIDILTLMGASMSAIEIMNVKMMKDVRNKINRAVNCDNANIEKSLRAAEKQIRDIELIDSVEGLDSLPDNLLEIAQLRYENPDYNLKQLGEALDPPISRSGANHRLQKIADIANEIRERKALPKEE